MLLYGKNSVFARLKVAPGTIRKILIGDSFKSQGFDELIKATRIPVEVLTSLELSRVKSAKTLQGIIAKFDPFGYTSFDQLITRAQKNQLSLIFLDRIRDPQNLGAIMRTSACFGNFALIIPKHKASEVTETALHIAAGGENYVPIAKVSSISTAIIQAKEAGLWIVGADTSDQAQSLNSVSFPFPLGFVLGFEGGGIRYGVGKNLNMRVGIPMKGVKLSLNVSVACAIFCHEISKQRRLLKQV